MSNRFSAAPKPHQSTPGGRQTAVPVKSVPTGPGVTKTISPTAQPGVTQPQPGGKGR